MSTATNNGFEKGHSVMDEKRLALEQPSEVRESDAEYEQNVQILRAMSPEEYQAFEKKLLWKCDMKIVPWMTLLFTMSFLDRVNVGTAKLAGLVEDLGMTASQFNLISTGFFITYVLFEVPSNLILKKVRPSRWIPFIVIAWAIVQVCMGLVTNFGQLLALRLLLGLFECGLFPGISLYLTGWYRRKEVSKRISIFFAGAVLAGAFGGILGYGLSQMQGVGGKNGWSWIFIIEGLITFIVGVGSIWMVYDWPNEATFLTPLERACVLHRLAVDNGVQNEGTFSWRIVRRACLDWKTWGFMLLYISSACSIYSCSIFFPTIISYLGKWSRPQSLLLSTPPFAFALCTTMATAYLSDKWGKRAFFLLFWFTVSIIGYILLLAVPLSSPGVLYFAVFIVIGGIAPCIATTIVWAGNTFGNHYKRATSMGLTFSLGNSGGIVASQIYRTEHAPRFIPGHAVSLGFNVMGLICTTILFFGLRRQNRLREARFGPITESLTTQPPSYASSEEEERGIRGDDIDSDEYKQRWGLEGMTREEIIELGDDHPSHRFLT